MSKFILSWTKDDIINVEATINSPSSLFMKRVWSAFPLICDLFPSPKVTLPPFLDSKTLKRDRSLVVCLKQPLSRYHKHVSITLNADFIMKHTSYLDDRSVGMVFSLICLLWAKSLTFTLLRRTFLLILILRQSSFFFAKLRYFPIVIIIKFK